MKLGKSLLALILFLLLLSSLSFLSRPTGYILNQNWLLTTNQGTQEIELPYYQYPVQSGLATFKTTFQMPKGDTLVIPKISCYAYKIYINDYLVAEIGDFSNPTSNIWNYAHVFSLDKKILRQSNDLLIKAHLLDDVGMHIPPFIDEKQNVIGRVSVFNFINNDMHLIMLGISISIASIIIALALFQKGNKKKYFLYLGLCTILGSVYSFDCIYRLYSGSLNTFLWVRKLLFCSCYLSGAILILGIENYTHKTLKIRKIIFGLVGISIFLILTSENFTTLRNQINVSNMLMVISPASALFMLSKSNNSQHLFFSMSFLTFTLGYTVLSVLLRANTPYLFQYGIIVFSIGLGVALIFEYTQIYRENIKIYKKSILDQLTNAYNRNILDEINLHTGDILILIDVDNLKYFNDNFGHTSGDILLKEVVSITITHIRESDYIIRLGGDEFLIILKDADYNTAKNIVERIRNEFKMSSKDKKIDLSFGIIEYESDFYSSFKKVDKQMYMMKFNKKIL